MFRDRSEAGLQLAQKLTKYAERKDAIVLGLPRGGVPVAFEIARELHLPLDVLLVRKLGVPGQAELAMGAIAAGGLTILDRVLIQQLGIPEEQVASRIAEEKGELHRREELYQKRHQWVSLADRCVIIVDDGIATGASMLAAIQVVRSQHPARVVVAVPVAPPHAQREIEVLVDEFVCLRVSEHFPAVGSFYRDFSQVSDEEVDLLRDQAAQFFAVRHADPSQQ